MNEEFFEELMATESPTGREDAAAAVWRKHVNEFADSVNGDFLGNSIAILRGGPASVMLAGHIDEIGFQIHYITEGTREMGGGFLYFRPLGGWNPQHVGAQRVRILTRNGIILGAIGSVPIHLLKPEDRTKIPEFHERWIDIGAKDEDDAKSKVEIGNVAVLDYDGSADLQNGLKVGRGLDDRLGAIAVAEVMHRVKEIGKFDGTLSVVATTQEEIGTRGVVAAANGILPQVGIAVDVGFATDTPGMKEARCRVGHARVGKGPLVATGPNINPKLEELILQVAADNGIPVQRVAWEGPTGTDARVLQITGPGVATALVSPPLRGMHTPGEIFDPFDLDQATELLALSVCEIKDPVAQFTR